MNTVEIVCPYCNKPSAVEKDGSAVDRHGLQKVRCTHCAKDWSANLSFAGNLEKSAGTSDLAALRVQVRGQLDELLKQIKALQERRAAESGPARFNTTGVEKTDVAKQELQKALANGKRHTFQTSPGARASEAMASSGRFVPDGVQKSDVAGQELTKALANGKPVTWQ
jgi:hypothetical protein